MPVFRFVFMYSVPAILPLDVVDLSFDLSFVRVMSKHTSTFAVFRFVRSCHPVALRSLQDNRTPRNINDTNDCRKA